jgi:acyl-CoA reductase-like NAD-dependent aldehyde dehydrogenase
MSVRDRVAFGEAGLFIGGKWLTEAGPKISVTDKYTGHVIGALPAARSSEIEAAVQAASRAAHQWGKCAAYARSALLAAVTGRIMARQEELARLIAAEAGKALKWARLEVQRATQTFTWAAEEAKRIHGETVPLDAVPWGEGTFGFFRRRPVGVVAAITPFNFPLNLVAHKVAPALAAGNTVVLKPASATPLTAVALCRIFEESGCPPGVLNLLAGPGHEVGEALARHPAVSYVSFTGSAAVGERLAQVAGMKKITLELGNTSPVIIDSDVDDLEHIARRCAVGAYYNSGQVCLSVQRIYVHKSLYERFVGHFVRASQEMVVGDPLDEHVDVGPMIDEREARRIEEWVEEAKAAGAEVLTGHKREGAIYWPTVLTKVTPSMKVVACEAFAPVASVIAYEDFREALAQADDTEYGLQAAVFTHNLKKCLDACDALHFGGVIINDVPTFRADHMPYGGMRKSGLGREGVRYAIEEMTSIQMVVIRR